MNKENPSFKTLHASFKWNGKSLEKADLATLAEDYLQSDEKYQQDIGEFLQEWLNPKSTIYVQTSGSTGKPRKMLVKKQYMVNSAMATGDFFELRSGTKALLCLPATYIAGKLMIVRALILGWDLHSVKPQAAPFSVTEEKFDFAALTPYQLKHSLPLLNRVKKIMVGGGAVSDSLLTKIQGISTRIFETYAMTETLTHIAARPINGPSKDLPPFQLLKDISIRQDDRGCLLIDAPMVSDDLIRTNDIVRMESKNNFYFLGRYDNVINSGGIKIIPEEVENKLANYLKERFFISDLPDDNLGQKVVLYIETEPSTEKLAAFHKKVEAIKDLPKYERPKEIILIPRFKETHSGKIQRNQTKDLLKN